MRRDPVSLAVLAWVLAAPRALTLMLAPVPALGVMLASARALATLAWKRFAFSFKIALGSLPGCAVLP